ncbi:hypothetical protein SEPCBS57363_001566 [Sporothrix epigloea]|uniref:Uncharacterized protein n=1 Tax=Sporothrix epigloea TaxID=1892477 RepID=A0ABP0DAZ2_9PEZI
MSSPLASAKIPAGSFLVSSGQHDGSSSWAGASSASLKSNRQPHIHADKDLYKPDEARLQKAQTRREDRQQHRDHDHSHRHHHHHHHHRQHHSWSTGSSAGHAGSHSTTIAALAATATAVAAASPITPVSSLPSSLLHQQTNKIGGSQGPEAVQSQNEQLQGQQHERQASMASGVGIPFDPVAVHAAAVALERIQREQSRNATRVLRAATTELDQLSSVTSQRLDAVYGSILTRLIVLQDTVLALRSLASAARATNRRFTSEAEAIAHEIGQQVMQLEAPDNASSDAATREEIGVVLTPADQQHRLELLSSRVHRGRQTIQDLAERVAMTHNKVQRWERADGVWQERTRARLKTLWVAISSALLALVLVVLLAVMLRSPGGNSGLDSTDSASAQTFGKSGHPTGNLDVASALPSSSKFQLKFSDRVDSANNGDDITATSQENDPLRRFLDEL